MGGSLLYFPAKRLWQLFGLFLWTVLVLGAGTIIGLALAEKGIPFSLESPNERYRAFVRSHVTLSPPEQSLWLRDMRDGSERRLARLSGEEERCVAVLWSDDSSRLAFLLDGSRLLVYEAASEKAIFDRPLAASRDYPNNRCVRHLRFLPDGDGVTYDLCHRWKAGVIESVELRF